MVYTDRPALTFWSNYIKAKADKDPDTAPSGIQRKPEGGAPDKNPALINKALQYLKEYGVTKKLEDIGFYGIRDWSRRPYVGAVHVWYPQREPWKILKRLSAFRISGDNKPHDPNDGLKNVHVCGEAYSDYQGFIEGALRSSEHVLHTMMPEKFRSTPTPWLCGPKCIDSDNHESEFKRLQGLKTCEKT